MEPVDPPRKRQCLPEPVAYEPPGATDSPASAVLRTQQGHNPAPMVPSLHYRKATQQLAGHKGATGLTARSPNGKKPAKPDPVSDEVGPDLHDPDADAQAEADGSTRPRRGRASGNRRINTTPTRTRKRKPTDQPYGPEEIVQRVEPRGEAQNTRLRESQRSAAKLSEQSSQRWIISQRRGTGYAANRSLRAVHRWQRRCAKRPDNVPPRKRPGSREARRWSLSATRRTRG